VLGDRAFVGHPEDRPRSLFAGEAQHHGREGRQQDRRADVGDVERVVHAVRVVLDVDRAGTRERRVQHLEVVPHLVRGPFVRKAEHVLDDPVMGRPQPERQATLAHRLGRERLLRHRDRVTALDRQDCGPDLDTTGRVAHQRDRRERIEVVRNLGYPDRRESACSAACASATRRATFSRYRPLSGPIITPIRTGAPFRARPGRARSP
jgi:hypothetical protein